MQSDRNPPWITSAVYAVAIAGAMFIVYGLVAVMKKYAGPPPVNQTRIAERRKALTEVQSIAKNELGSYGVIDASKGLYRLKIDQAMALTEQWYKNPEAARSNLVERAEKANFVPPPPKFE